jgi:hypothetical protein
MQRHLREVTQTWLASSGVFSYFGLASGKVAMPFQL